MDSSNEQPQAATNVLTFDPKRPRVPRQTQGQNHKGRIEGVIVSNLLDRTPIVEMTPDDASIGKDSDMLAAFRRDISAIERAYRQSQRAGRLAFLAFAREHFAAGYNAGADDDRISLRQAIRRLVA
jgi:hypothetical protein